MTYTGKPSTLPRLATGTGSEIVGDLTLTAAEWVENEIVTSSFQYGKIQYTCSGSPDLSGVLLGHYLTVTGFTNSENNGSMKVLSKDNTAKTITVLMTERTSDLLDETGATASGSVRSSGAALKEPSESKKNLGFASPEKPSDGMINWLFYWLYFWINWVQTVIPSNFVGGEKLTAGTGIEIEDNAIVVGLTVTAAEWVENTIENGDTLGLVRYTCDTADLSAIEPGQYLVVTDLDNASNEGTFQIADSDDGANTIDVYSSRTDDSDDETGSSGSAYVHDGTKLISADLSGALTVSQTGHGFSACEVVKDDGTGTWEYGSANGSPEGVSGLYVVVSVVDANTFKVAKIGRHTIPNHGLKSNTNVVYSSGDMSALAWQSGNTIRGTHDTAVHDLSPVSSGDWIHVDLRPGTAARAMQRGYFKLTAANNTSDYFEWTNPDISANTYDLSSITDDDNRFVVYGDAVAGDVLYLGDTDGELCPFPAHNGIVFPVLTVVDDNTVDINIPASIPKDPQPRTLVDYIDLPTPNDADDDFDFLARDLFDFRNPQNWRLRIFTFCEDGTESLTMALSNVTHRGGYTVTFAGQFVATSGATIGTKASGAVSAQASPAELSFKLSEAIDGGDEYFSTTDFIYDGRDLIIESTTYNDDHHHWYRMILRQVDLSSAALKDIGAQDTKNLDVKIVRV